MVDATTILLILAVSAFVPPLVFLAIVRRTERYGREPWTRVLRTFFWGAIFAVVIAAILELLLSNSLEVSLATIGVRSVSSALLHASASATFGYGIALDRLWPARFSVLPYYLLAVAMHSTFNFFASFDPLLTPVLGPDAALYGFGGAILLAVGGFIGLRWLIRHRDAERVTW